MADIDAIERCDSPDVAVWINVTGRTQNRESGVKLLRTFTQRVSELHYEIASREFFPGGFVQRHVLRGKVAGGDPIAVPVCLVIHVEDGQIRSLYEYLDSVAISPVFA